MKSAKVNALIQQALERQLDNAKMLDLEARDDVDLETEYSDFIRKRAKIERLKESGRYGTPAQRKQADQSNEEIINKSISGIMKGIIEGKNVKPAVKALRDFVGNINMSPQMRKQLARQYVNIERFQKKGYEGLQRVPYEDRKQLLELGKVIQDASGKQIPLGMLGIDQQQQTPMRTPTTNSFQNDFGELENSTESLNRRQRGQILRRARERISKGQPLTEQQNRILGEEQGKQFSRRTDGQQSLLQHFPEQSGSSKGTSEVDDLLRSIQGEKGAAVDDDDVSSEKVTSVAWKSPAKPPGFWEGSPMFKKREGKRYRPEGGPAERPKADLGKRQSKPIQRFTGFSPARGLAQPGGIVVGEQGEPRAMTVEESRIPLRKPRRKKKQGKGLKGGKRIIYDTAMNVAKKVKGSTKKIHHQVAMELLKILGEN